MLDAGDLWPPCWMPEASGHHAGCWRPLATMLDAGGLWPPCWMLEASGQAVSGEHGLARLCTIPDFL